MLGVPSVVRNSKPSENLRILWATANFVAVPVLYLLANGTWGDEVLSSWFGAYSSASSQVRGTVFAMCLLRVIGHNLWGMFLCPHALPVMHTVQIAGFSFLLDASIILLTLWNRTEYSLVFDNLLLAVYLCGQFLERVSEIDRTVFKSQPANKGKMHIAGFYSIVVHPNYLGFLIRQFAFLAFTGLWWLPLLLTSCSVLQFVYGDVKLQRERNVKKYGDEFKLYWDTTPKLLPGVY